jgi:quercetin dioxygenase-like cupin family protein
VRMRVFGGALVAVTAALACAVLAVPAQADETEMLGRGPVGVPPGGSFVSIVEFPQPPGAKLGPHGHFGGFVYVESGEAALVEEGRTTTLGAGESHFVPALAVHTHENADDRLPAGALAIALVLAVVALVVAVRSPRTRVVLVPVLLAGVVAGGAIALWNPWKNDWFFLAVRSEATRGAPMPIPSAENTYASPPLSGVRPGTYMATLAETTVDARGQLAASRAAGPIAFMVLEGSAEVSVSDDRPIQLGQGDATLVQPGGSIRITNPNESTLRLLRFALMPAPASS